MGFDIVHYNLHKTFSQPHGGGRRVDAGLGERGGDRGGIVQLGQVGLRTGEPAAQPLARAARQSRVGPRRRDEHLHPLPPQRLVPAELRQGVAVVERHGLQHRVGYPDVGCSSKP